MEYPGRKPSPPNKNTKKLRKYPMSHLSINAKAIVPTVRRLIIVTTAVALVMGTIGYMPAHA